VRVTLYAWALIILGLVDIFGAIPVLAGKITYPLWVQVGNAIILGLLLIALGVDRLPWRPR
jgi:hypothetical protein